MRTKAFIFLLSLFFVAFLLIQIQTPITTNGQVSTAEVPEAAKQHLVEAYGKLPLAFEANHGQTDSQVKFLSRGSGYTLFLTSSEAVLALRKPQEAEAGIRAATVRERTGPETGVRSLESEGKGTVLRMKLVGANPHPEVSGLEELPGKSNYFLGNDPERWRTNVPNYAKVEYREVYPGVDLFYYGNQRQLEFDFVLAPGADPTAIALHFEGADKVEVDAQGELVLHIADEQVQMRKPLVYQEADGVRQEIDGGYVLQEGHQIGFQVASYDASKPLVIDPVLVYSTYLGGSDDDEGFAIAVDSSGNAYVTGGTDSTNFPTVSPFQAAFIRGGPADAFVTKLSPTGSTVVYSTYLGGRDFDAGFGIAVDSSGNAYVTGITGSINFPTASPFQPAFGGGSIDAFVMKLNASGNALLYSTYLGGSGNDVGERIAVDLTDSAYVVGGTTSTNFPIANPLQVTIGDSVDAFVAKLNPSGNNLVYSTYLGGSDFDTGIDIAVDSSGNAYVTGATGSTDFPTASPFQAAFGGGIEDAFVTKLNTSGNALVYSTYLGGSDDDVGFAIAVDSSGNAYVTGVTDSTDLPTANALQSAFRGVEDAFVTKLNAAGNALVYSTYLGGSDLDRGFGIAVDSSGNAYVTGRTLSPFFPTAKPFQPAFGDNDAFVTKLNPSGNVLVYSTYLGGSDFDTGIDIAVDASGNAYVAGYTHSTNFPTASPFQAAFGGVVDAFVAKIMELTPGTPTPTLPPNSVVNGASFRPTTEQNSAVAPGAIVAIFGTDLAGSTQVATVVPLPTTLLDTSVTFNNIPAPLLFVSSTQINAQVPFEVQAGTGLVVVKRGNVSATRPVSVAAFSPGIFTINGQGTGAGAILHAEDFRPVSDSAPARPGEFISIFCTGLGRLRSPIPSGAVPPSPPPETLSLPQVNIAGIPAQVTYSGLAPGFVGLYQVNAQVPAGAPSGALLLQIIINGVPSNTVTIAVQ